MKSVKNPVDLNHLPVCSEEQNYSGWTVKSKKSHILSSKCTSDGNCVKDSENECQFCRFVIKVTSQNHHFKVIDKSHKV